ncbi:MAG: GNAT family N-acetyltransferase [Gammaproteobacteria bacterium]|nr:GNAT family N-acetyltransferase [Gammaproteobacteria bacterium]MDP2347003.1 GNAT family N-acetyltransferase [Gammaproteobacteria bacterium]
MLYRAIRKLTPVGIDYQSVVFFLLDLKQRTFPLSEASRPVACHIIDSTQDQWFRILSLAYPAQQFHLRMQHDCQQCHIAIVDGNLVGYAWVTTSPCHISEINFTLPVGLGRLYIYDCFVESAYRGQGIYQSLLMTIIADYRKRRWPNQYRTACIGAEPDNTASILGIKRAGFEEFTRARYVHVGQFSRWYGVNSLIAHMSANRPDQVVSD